MDGVPIERRDVVKGVGAGVLGSLLPGAALGAEPDAVTVLGDFESSLDDWKTNGGNTLERHAGDDWARPVTSGDGALEVRSGGDPGPLVYNRKRLRKADLERTPYLLADVTVGGFETSADLAFQFRYHHDGSDGEKRDGGSGRDGGDPGQSRSPNVETSEEMVVPQAVQTTLTWDLGGLSSREQRRGKRLDLAWRAASDESGTGPSGRGPGDGLNGSVYVDNVRLVDSRRAVAERALARQLTTLKARHGSLSYENDSADVEALSERGRFVFADGTAVEVEFTADDLDRWRYTIDGETHRLGGGWE